MDQSKVQQFHRDGYIAGGPVLDPSQLGQLHEEIERVIRDNKKPGVKQPVQVINLTGDQAQPVWQIVNIWQASEPFDRLIRASSVASDVAQLLRASEVRLWHDQIQYKPAGVGGINMWHQDWPYWGILSAPHQVTAWVALDDVDEENGCMWMVPGSHLWGNNIDYLQSFGQDFEAMPSSYEGRPITIKSCPVKAGHVHYHHAMTWHGSNRNRSGRKRRAIALHLMGDQTHYNASGNHVMKRFVNVSDGQPLRGDAFPLLWSAPIVATI